MGGNKEYLVTWEVNVWADSPRDAAERARAMQTVPKTTAVAFTVADIESDELTEIDLLEEVAG